MARRCAGVNNREVRVWINTVPGPFHIWATISASQPSGSPSLGCKGPTLIASDWNSVHGYPRLPAPAPLSLLIGGGIPSGPGCRLTHFGRGGPNFLWVV